MGCVLFSHIELRLGKHHHPPHACMVSRMAIVPTGNKFFFGDFKIFSNQQPRRLATGLLIFLHIFIITYHFPLLTLQRRKHLKLFENQSIPFYYHIYKYNLKESFHFYLEEGEDYFYLFHYLNLEVSYLLFS